MRQWTSGATRARRVPAAIVVCLSAFALTACMEEAAAPGAEAGAANVDAGDGADETAAVMPDVVCMDLQEAQDTIQETGVFLSKSVDATGEGRRQIVDRNWVVVEQSPVAGTPIDEGEAVLSVVKDDEPSSCTSETAAELAAAATTIAATTTTAAPTTTLPPTTTMEAPTTTAAAPTTLATTTAVPTTTVAPPPPPAPTTPVAVQPFIPQDCHPSYEGACVPFAEDVDCAGGTGNGPEYVTGPVRIVGPDEYGLDGNPNDGVGCEP